MWWLVLAISLAAEPADNGLFSWLWRKSKKKEDKPIEFVSTSVTVPVVKSVTDSDTNRIASYLAPYGIDIARSEFDSFFATSRYADTASTNCLNYSMDYNEANCKYRYGILTMCQLQSRKNSDMTLTGSVVCAKGTAIVLAESETKTTKRLLGIKVGGKTSKYVRLLTDQEVTNVYNNVRGATETKFKAATPNAFVQ